MKTAVGSFRDQADLPAMIVLPAGHFRMGSPDHEPGRVPDPHEGPQREMRIGKAFAIADVPVTRALFRRFVTDSGIVHRGVVRCHDDGTWRADPARGFENPGFAQFDDHPAVGLSWHDAHSCAAWVASRTGRRYRLPSEAEWEYAARATTTGAFWWGNDISPSNANCDFRAGYAGRPPTGSWQGGTCAVWAFPANPFGLRQTSGNVWEWCADVFCTTLAALPGDGVPALGNETGARVLRGGSFLNGPWNLRSACRLGDPEGFRHASFGVRLACDT